MGNTNKSRGKLFLLIFATVLFMLFIATTTRTNSSIPNLRLAPKSCPLNVTQETITPLTNTKHLLVSAFMDQRVKGFDLRIIAIFRRDSIQPLHCLFCCSGQLSTTTPAGIFENAHNFGFPFVTTDVMCAIPQDCSATHVSLLTRPDRVTVFYQTWLPIRNQKTKEKEEKKLQFNFTVCISNLFNDYNNVLQYAQTLEMYRLLGVDRVVIYNTSCGPDLDRLLQSYSQEGFVEMVPWPIDKHMSPSQGWNFEEHGGDIHYFGQLPTLNECIYRSMDRSRYVLLHDIDEIIMPYQHNSLTSLMDMLQQQHPNAGVFLVENHIHPKKPFEESKRGPLPNWRGVPGFDILEHIYKWEPDEYTPFHSNKLIVQPRMVAQTSVHQVLGAFGEQVKIPPELCHLIHSPLSTPTVKPVEKIHVDTRLWDFKEQLIPNVNNVLKRAGLLQSEEQS